jgi:hypothetical protein
MAWRHSQGLRNTIWPYTVCAANPGLCPGERTAAVAWLLETLPPVHPSSRGKAAAAGWGAGSKELEDDLGYYIRC